MNHMTPLENLLAPGANGILSARCCSKSAAVADEQVIQNLEKAAERLSREIDIHLETISNAQRSLMFLNGSLDSRQQSLVTELFALYKQHGLGVFPVVILDGRIAFHSSQPTAEQIEQVLREPVSA